MKIKMKNDCVANGYSYESGETYEVDEKRAESYINLGWAERESSDEEKLVVLLKKLKAGLVVIPDETPSELIDLCAQLKVPTQVRRVRVSSSKKKNGGDAEDEE